MYWHALRLLLIYWWQQWLWIPWIAAWEGMTNSAAGSKHDWWSMSCKITKWSLLIKNEKHSWGLLPPLVLVSYWLYALKYLAGTHWSWEAFHGAYSYFSYLCSPFLGGTAIPSGWRHNLPWRLEMHSGCIIDFRRSGDWNISIRSLLVSLRMSWIDSLLVRSLSARDVIQSPPSPFSSYDW